MKIYINGKNVYVPKSDFLCLELDELDKKNIGSAIGKYSELKYFMQVPDKADYEVKSHSVSGSTMISGFPGVGKSTLSHPEYKDLDSSLFDRQSFPTNYIQAIHDQLFTLDDMYVGISCHVDLLRKLTEYADNEWYGADLVIVYPKYELKEEYLQRYRDRGSPEGFVKLMDEKWDAFSQDIRSHIGPNVYHIELEAGQFLSDVIKFEVN